jgi:Uma2 family endonuclease
MSSSTIRPQVFNPEAPEPRAGRPSIPNLDELREWTAEPEHRVVIRDVDWAFYEQLVDSIPASANLHVDYDGKDLEIMGKGRKHEAIRELLGQLVRLVTEELEIACTPLGEMTWKRPEIPRGLEADQCYYFESRKLAANAAARARDSDDISDYPNPDLAIEVDISEPQVDRAGIYSALSVPEVWRFVDDQVIIEQLGEDGHYHIGDTSRFLPIRADEIRRWVVEEDSSVQWSWARHLRAWVTAEVMPRFPR